MVSWILNSRAVQWALTIGGGLLAFAALLWRAYARGERKAKSDSVEDAHERTQKGREAVADGRERGSPDERVRHNDARW